MLCFTKQLQVTANTKWKCLGDKSFGTKFTSFLNEI